MRPLYFDDPDLDYFLRYALAGQTYQASAHGECFAAAAQVREDDLDSWVTAWTAMAQQVEHRASDAELKGHRISAAQAYLRASTYHATAIIGLGPSDQRFRPAYQAFRAAFRRFAALSDLVIEPVELPFEDASLSGYLVRAGATAGTRRRPGPAIVLLGDRFAEEMYVWGGAQAAVRRGYQVLLVDLPGQGLSPFDGLHTRADAEVPVHAIIDFLLARDDIDPARVALFGMASAGYAATRAAAADRRIAAVISDSPLHDMAAIMSAEAPAADTAHHSPVRKVLFELTSWQIGSNQLPEMFALMRRMRVPDVSAITCPMLCLVSESEAAERVRQTRAVHDALPHPGKDLHVFTAAEGADDHNQAGNLALLHQISFDWLDEVLA